MSEALSIRFGEHDVSALLDAPADARAALVLAHGAGAGMAHPFMTRVAQGLAERDVATLRYQFPYMERRSRRTDPPKLAHTTVRAAVAEAAGRLPGVPLFAGGKSFGGRMTSQAQALEALRGVRGLVFLGFPLHPPGKPSVERAEHLFEETVPMLFLQGARDDFAEPPLLEALVAKLGARATLRTFEHADHSFGVPKRLARGDAVVALLEVAATWMLAHVV